MGWLPKEKYLEQGRPEKNWVDAETYVERGEEVLPLLRANNKQLVGQVTELQTKTSELAAQLASANESIEALKDLRTTLNIDKVKKEKTEILDSIKVAKQEGDVDAEVALTDKLTQVNAALKEAEKPAVKTVTTATPPPITPEAQAWMGKNPWFGTDLGKTGYAQGLAQEWQKAGKKLGTQEFFDHVDAKVAEVFDPNRARREGGSKVSETTNSERTDGGTSGRSFSDLPADAKEAFERQAKKLVGPGKVYKTRQELQKVYVDQYDWS
jgi:chromosome segregation ATPase